jgi:hypothetical protein
LLLQEELKSVALEKKQTISSIFKIPQSHDLTSGAIKFEFVECINGEHVEKGIQLSFSPG